MTKNLQSTTNLIVLILFITLGEKEHFSAKSYTNQFAFPVDLTPWTADETGMVRKNQIQTTTVASFLRNLMSSTSAESPQLTVKSESIITCRGSRPMFTFYDVIMEHAAAVIHCKSNKQRITDETKIAKNNYIITFKSAQSPICISDYVNNDRQVLTNAFTSRTDRKKISVYPGGSRNHEIEIKRA